MNILIVGLGSIAQKHIKAINLIEKVPNFYALRSKFNQKEEKFVKNIYELKDLKIKFDFAIVSNPTQLHEETIIKLIDLKVPIFIEKPVMSNYKNAKMISELLNKNRIITYVACNMRFHPSIKFLKSYIEKYNPVINEINVYCGSYLPKWRKSPDYKNSYSSNPQMGGGVHLDLIHELDYCSWIFGSPNKINSIKRSVSNLKIKSIDFANYTLMYDQFCINLTLNYYRINSKRVIEIVTDLGEIIIDLLSNSVVYNNKILYSGDFSIQNTYNEQMKYFMSNIKKTKQPMNGFDEGVKTLKLATNE